MQKRKPGQPHRKWKDAARHRFTREEAFKMAIRAGRANSKRIVPTSVALLSLALAKPMPED